MKKITLSLIAVGFFVVVSTASAQMGMMGNNYWQNNSTANQLPQDSELSKTLQGIYTAQEIDSLAQIDCSKISDDQFGEIGDNYMSLMLPNKRQHEAMDNMMGGEGSASLRQAHINMARSHLGCWSNYNSGPIFMPMMGSYGTDSYDGNSYSMMNSGYGYPMWWGGSGGYGIGGMFFMTFWLILAVIGIVAVIKWITTVGNKK